MRATTSNMVKGLGIGMAVGGAAAMLGVAMMNPSMKKQTKRNAMKAMRTFGDVMDSMQTMIK